MGDCPPGGLEESVECSDGGGYEDDRPDENHPPDPGSLRRASSGWRLAKAVPELVSLFFKLLGSPFYSGSP